MSITRKQAKLLATSMVNHPTKVYQLHKDGDFGVVDDGLFRTLYRFAPNSNGDKYELVWQQSVESLVEQEPKLKFKTHLTEYLYLVLTPKIKEIKSRGLTGNEKINAILKSEKYNKYLQNNRIEIETYENNEDQIRISTGSTGFANHTKFKYYTKEELLSLHEEVRQLAVNDSRATIHKPYKKKKFIEENYEQYDDAYRRYLKDFRRLGQLWEWKLSNDGIRQGYGDDDVYKEVILPIEFRLQGLKYNNRVIREINTVVRELNQMKRNLEDPSFSGLHIYL